ncbi:MAG TPA: LysM domain-containing protein [Ruminiclostridium sp.]|nr:LysM domain-containing protein [Ruminiclostridium sp.]
MAYMVYLDGIPMPVTPSKIEMKIKNQNKTLNLIDGSEINVQKAPGLTEFSFEVMIPQVKGYPFAFYPDEIVNGKHEKTEFICAQYYLDLFQRLKTEKPYFRFDIKRTSPAGQLLFDTQTMTSLEEYSVSEDSGNGLDLTVTLNLKQYRDYSTFVYTIGKDNRLIITNSSTQKTVPKPYKVKQGDTLWAICQKYLHDGSKYPLIAKLNGIKNPNLIKVGQVIRFG